MDWLKWIHQDSTTPRASVTVNAGDEVRVWFRLLEQGKERFGQFEGLVIRVRGAASAKTFTVRRVTHGEGVERIFPLDAKVISRIEVLRRGQVKRSRLYFLRSVVGKRRIASAEAPTITEKSTEAVPLVNIPAPDVRAPAGTSEGAVAAANPSEGTPQP